MMGNFSESDITGLELCPHGDRRKFCVKCESPLERADWSGVMALQEIPELAIEAECSKLLEEDGWTVWKTTPVSDRRRAIGFGQPGMADITAFRPIRPSYPLGPQCCEVLFVEFKTGKQKAKSHQVQWHRDMRAAGFVTWIANEDFPATVEGFREHYAQSGMMRRKKWWV
jgi:hypothetical protein